VKAVPQVAKHHVLQQWDEPQRTSNLRYSGLKID